MSEQKLNEWENKAVEIIKIVNGLSQTQINHIFSLVNYSVIQSSIEISFQRKSLVYQNADKNNFVEKANELLDKSLEENVFIHT